MRLPCSHTHIGRVYEAIASLDCGRYPLKCLDDLVRPSEQLRRGCGPFQVLRCGRIAGVASQHAKMPRIRQRIDGIVVCGYTTY